MINLFERFDNRAIRIYNSFKWAKMSVKTVVIHETGFLPNDVITPYRYFAQHQDAADTPLYFNQLEVPNYWLIEDEKRVARVKDKGELRAIIHYQVKRRRVVEHVDWLTPNGETQFTDYYNKQGFKYAQTVFNPQTKQPMMRIYFDRDGNEFYTENLMTHDILLTWQGKSYHFDSQDQFISFFLTVSGFDVESILTNAFILSIRFINQIAHQGVNYLYWQENVTPEVLQRLRYLWQNGQRPLKVVLPDPEQYQVLIQHTTNEELQNIIKGGYVYQFEQHSSYGNNVLIMTHSDQLLELDTIIQSNPNATFHIAALTDMSQKLLQFGNYDNVHLYPKMTQAQHKQLYQQANIYLDINEGKEILNAVRTAFNHQLLILANRTVVHNAEVVASDNIRKEGLGILLQEVLNHPETFKTRLQLQMDKAGARTPEKFRTIFQ